MPLALLDIGTNPNDNTGNNLRAGGAIINAAITAINDLPQQTAQNANLVLCGPASGAAALATFRALVALDLGSGTGVTTKFLRGDMTWQTVAGGSATWGSITGTLSAQTDLQTALTTAAITSGTIDGTVIGGAAQEVINGTNIIATGYLKTDLGTIYVHNASIDNTGGYDLNLNPWTPGTGVVRSAAQIEIVNVSSPGTVTGGCRFYASGGVASAINDGESSGLPLTRNVGTGTVSLGGILINAGANTTVAITVTGLVQGDSVTIDYDNQLPQGTGGVVESSRVVSAGTVMVQLTNTDVAFGYTLSGNIYARVKR